MRTNRFHLGIDVGGTFTDVAPQLGVTSPTQSFPGWFWDFDNDGALDLLVGDMLISQAGAAIRQYEDGMAITFNPITAEPWQLVTVTSFFENAGTDSTDTDTFARMYVDGELEHTHREGALDPRPPTGNGNSASFSFDWSGGLGEHTFELNLDEHGNVTQTRTDNDVTTTILTIIFPGLTIGYTHTIITIIIIIIRTNI